jgi:hypothetical protein
MPRRLPSASTSATILPIGPSPLTVSVSRREARAESRSSSVALARLLDDRRQVDRRPAQADFAGDTVFESAGLQELLQEKDLTRKKMSRWR